MLSGRFLGRRVFVVLLLLFFSVLLFSCRKDAGCQWVISRTNACAPFNFARVYLPSNDLLQGMDVEFTRSCSGVRMFINLYLCPLEGEKAELTYKIDGKEYKTLAFVLEGGQRLSLTCEDQEKIIQSLFQGLSVHISVGMYQLEIPAINFSEMYEKMIDIPM